MEYQIDEEGYLIDEDGNYVTDEEGNRVKLNEEQIEQLKEGTLIETN